MFFTNTFYYPRLPQIPEMVQLKFGVGIKNGKIQYHDTTPDLVADLMFGGAIWLYSSNNLERESEKQEADSEPQTN